jgi:hypothetical protein
MCIIQEYFIRTGLVTEYVIGSCGARLVQINSRCGAIRLLSEPAAQEGATSLFIVGIVIVIVRLSL